MRAGIPAHAFPSYVSSLGENISRLSGMVGLDDCGGGKGFGGDNDEVVSEMGDSYYTDTEDEAYNNHN